MAAAWGTGARKMKAADGIKVPGGVYKPQTDNLTFEIGEAAKSVGLGSYNVKGENGVYYDTPDDLPTNSVAEAGEISIEAYDTAGR